MITALFVTVRSLWDFEIGKGDHNTEKATKQSISQSIGSKDMYLQYD